MESYLRQCTHKNQPFVEEITWKNNGKELREHKTKLNHACFGCNFPKDGPALCGDLILNIISVPEILDSHCDNNLNLVEP
ncbi:MAG: hypothetical protein CMH63_00085 [Nanoarchaeota archaeon]|jgi:hypothetical protein|nr:hypothetical protein [Nanoarchaeota archaeon]|tara:strand:+ start:569 stop:808 length:240 start_codon:yes stop_codon:yes gene_type:complete